MDDSEQSTNSTPDYSNATVFLPQTAYDTTSPTPQSNVDLVDSSSPQLLASYSFATNPTYISQKTAEYYSDTTIDQSTLWGAIQSKYGFYK
jgi:hypothetical protein